MKQRNKEKKERLESMGFNDIQIKKTGEKFKVNVAGDVLNINIGNSKVGNDTLILSRCAVQDCPSRRRGLCEIAKGCYCEGSETRFKAVTNCRNQDREFLNKYYSNLYLMEYIILEAARKAKGIKYLRFNETGDITSSNELKRMNTISRWVKNEGITSYTYSHRRDLIPAIKAASNIIINTSNWRLKGFNCFISTHKSLEELKILYPGFNEYVNCPGSCLGCPHCKEKTNSLIRIPPHGIFKKYISEAAVAASMGVLYDY